MQRRPSLSGAAQRSAAALPAAAVIIVAAALNGAVVANCTADTGADKPMVTGEMPHSATDHGTTQAAGMSRLYRRRAGQRQYPSNKHHRFFHAQLLSIQALGALVSEERRGFGRGSAPAVRALRDQPFELRNRGAGCGQYRAAHRRLDCRGGA